VIAQDPDEWLTRGLSPREKIELVVEIAAAYARARWLLRHSDLPTTVAALRSAPAPPRNTQVRDSTRAGLRLGRAMARTLRPIPFDSRCLMRSLVLTRLLARRGIDSSLVIAVQSEPTFRAHAWVERDGVPLLEPAGPPFHIIAEL
jgi:hypothetical protein